MTIIIKSEEEAWKTRQDLLDGRMKVGSADKLVFGDWVKASVYTGEAIRFGAERLAALLAGSIVVAPGGADAALL